jgi:hypothetical protein
MRKLLILSLLLLPLAQAAPSEENTAEVPTDREVKKLALDSLLLFNVAIQTKSFDNFYTRIAQLWQKETTPAELLRTFRSFVEQNANIAPIAKEKPDFEEAPTVNADGILVLKGLYPTQPNNVFFELKYVFEDESWKLVGIHVQTKPASDAPPKKGKDKKAKDSQEEDEEEPPAD